MYQRQALHEIPALPNSLLRRKYIITADAYYDPHSVENFMKEVIRGTGPDAPLFEQDLPRQRINPLSHSILSMQEHGSRYSHDPYHPELFLGDLTKDDRMSATDPLVSKMNDQHKFRHKRYIEGKMQVSQDSRTEGLVGGKRILRQVKQGYHDTVYRMGGIFGDSTNTLVGGANPKRANSIHQVGDSIKEDQKIYEVGDEKILPHYSADIVNKISNQVGINWQVQPDNKFKVSSISNLYRTKQDVDQSRNAVYRLGQQDTKFKMEKSGFKNGSIMRTLESIKESRKNVAKVNTNKESLVVSWSKKVMRPPTPISCVQLSKGTHSVKAQFESKGPVYKNRPNHKLPETLVEPLKSRSMKTVHANINIPPKDRMVIAYQIRREKYAEYNNENKTKAKKISLQNYKGCKTYRPDPKNEQTFKSNFMNVAQRFSVPTKSTDHFQSELTESKFGEARQYTASNLTGSNTMPKIKTISDFEFDTDPTTNNNYMNRSGVIQRMTKLSSRQEQDSVVSPLADSVTPFKTNYRK